jgi:hypothetical protein
MRGSKPPPALAVLAVVCALAVAPGVRAATPETSSPILAGRSLSEALRLLQARGWPVVFSSRLVRDSMQVASEPEGDSRQAILADLLRPHGLAVRDGARDRLVVVAGVREHEGDRGRDSRQVRPPSLPTSPPIGALPPDPAASVEEEIVVTPDRDTLRGSSVVLFDLESGDSQASPQLGNDPLNAVAALPGGSSAQGSAPVNVRGGGDDDLLVRLDGLELVRPYHLGDFDNAVSFVAPTAVERADLFTGTYPAQYGDRMGGVVDLTTRTPTQRRHFSLGLDVLGADGAASGRLGDRASWLVTARSGSYQWPLEMSGRDEHPRYWDTFGKFELDFGPSQTLLADVLVARDNFELSNEHRGADGSYGSGWSSSYAWIRHTAVLGRDLYTETVIGTGDVEHTRAGRSTASANPFGARDRRSLQSDSARQDWHWEASPLGALEWGFEYGRSNTTLDFWSDRRDPEPLSDLPGGSSIGDGGVLERFRSTNLAAYVSARLQPARRLSLEIGLRHDTLTFSDENHVSPRLSAAWEVGAKTVVRAAWGQLFQSQRPYELQLEEGRGAIGGIGSERAEHQDLSFERELGHGMMIELAAYRRRVEAPRVRFENLFDPALVFPELGEDRVRIAPERGSAEGVELTLRQPRRRRLGWWATYSESSVLDEVDGQWVPRSTDQPHSFRAGLDLRAGRAWSLGLLWQYHSGWPTTAVAARRIDGADGTAQWLPVLGPRNGERLPDYHRLDLRVGRSWSLALGRLEAHVDLLDVYDRENLRGFENIRLVPDGTGGFEVTRQPVTWTGFVPSIGVRWTF